MKKQNNLSHQIFSIEINYFYFNNHFYLISSLFFQPAIKVTPKIMAVFPVQNGQDPVRPILCVNLSSLFHLQGQFQSTLEFFV